MSFECFSGYGSKVEKKERYRHRRLGKHALSACFDWLGKQAEAFCQASERGHFVRELHSHRPDLAAALDRFLDVEAVECAERVLGQLVGRQQVPMAIKEATRVGEGDSLELAHHLLERNLGALLDAVLAGADILKNLVVLKQAAGVYRCRRGGVDCAGRAPRALSVFEVFQDEALLPVVQVLTVFDHSIELSTAGDLPRLNFAR